MHTEPELRKAGPFTLAGFVCRASYEDASPIGGLWQQYFERAGEAGADGAPVAAYHDYESDYRGAYSLLLGTRCEGAAPDGWSELTVPEAEYLVFPVPDGQMPDVLIATWQAIWAHFDESCVYERAYTFDLELHGASPEILISVQRRE